jgi:DNA-binding CsgD family transcriptional regulator
MFTVKEASDTGTAAATVRLASPALPVPRSTPAAPLVVWQWLTAALDELDYGIVLLTGGTHVAYVNYAARVELDERHPLQLDRKTLQARAPADAAALRNAIGQASERGLRRLLTVGTADRQASMSIVPLEFHESDCRAVLVVLGKSAVCESLSLQGYARAHGLTSAETRVLGDLCSGAEPAEIASRLGVAISTIRSHICSMRAKTGAPSIRALVRQVAVLPPLKGVLREEHACALAA